MRRLLLLSVLALCLLVPPEGSADDGALSGVIVGFGGGFHERARWDMNVRYEGAVTVRFAGAGQSGTIVWTPGRQGQFTAAEGRDLKGKRAFQAYLGPTGGQMTVAHVTRGGKLCSDWRQVTFDGAAVSSETSGVSIGLADASRAGAGFQLTETNCGGPLSGALAQVLRRVAVPAAKLRAGRFDVDLRASGAFADGPLKGTVDSTVVAHVGRIQRQPRDRFPTTRHRYRELEVRYRIERVSGTVAASFKGGELCEELASCGDAGSWLLRMPGRGGIFLSVSAPASRPARDLFAVAGLTKTGNKRGLDWGGGGGWRTAAGTITATSNGPGEEPCSDTRRTTGGALQLFREDAFMRVTAYAVAGVPRTRCPGPGFGEDPFGGAVLGSARVPLSSFGRKRIRIVLSHGVPIDTDGWKGSTEPKLTLILRRGRVRTFVRSY